MKVERSLLETTGMGCWWCAILMIQKIILIYNNYSHLNTYLGIDYSTELYKGYLHYLQLTCTKQ